MELTEISLRIFGETWYTLEKIDQLDLIPMLYFMQDLVVVSFVHSRHLNLVYASDCGCSGLSVLGIQGKFSKSSSISQCDNNLKKFIVSTLEVVLHLLFKVFFLVQDLLHVGQNS